MSDIISQDVDFDDNFNQNLYDMPDDIASAQLQVQMRNQGRALARKYRESSFQPTFVQLDLICHAAASSSNLDRIAQLEKQLQESKGQVSGLRYQLENKTNERTGSNDDLDAALRVIKLLSGGNRGQ